MILGLSHITLIVKDLGRASQFLKSILDADEVYSSGDKTFSLSKEKYFLVGGIWMCIMEGEPAPGRTYGHIAFRIDEEDLNVYVEKIRLAGAEIRPGRPRAEGEGRSVYFYDFDGHLFELHTGSLKGRLEAYSKK